MEITGVDSKTDVFRAQALLLSKLLSVAGPMSLLCAVKLGIPDILHNHGKPMSLHELAKSASVPKEKEPMLRRMMRLLVHEGIFAMQNNVGDEDGDNLYILTPCSRLLLKDGTVNLCAYVQITMDQQLLKSWYFTAEWFQMNGSRPFELAYGVTNLWDLTTERPELNDLFNDAMAADSRCTIRTLIAECPHVFNDITSLIDVGGGTGTTARLISKAFPHLKCTIFDLPHVVATAPESTNVNAIGGDMFEYIPRANAILLKNILHDWDDAESVKILKNCKSAISFKQNRGKVIIIDSVMKSQLDIPEITKAHLYFDLNMMVAHQGMEREEKEWRKIFIDAGFANYKIYSVSSPYSVIEVYP